MMNKQTFGVKADATGKNYIYQINSELDKNHGINDDNSETTGKGRIYELPDNPKCPVKNFRDYIFHLHPLENSFWQRPLESFTPEQSIWYYRAPLGEKPLGNMMAKMSLKYGLSERYTNHSVRVTALQLLDDNNIKDRHVVRVSGHKSTDSIKNYARRLSASRKRNISSVISKHIANPTFKLVSDDVFDPSVAHTASLASSIIRESPNNATSSCSTIRRQSANNNNAFALVNSSDHDDDIFMNVPNKMLVAPSPSTRIDSQ